MNNIEGFNPLRWNCKVGGCFNLKRRPKIEYFADCFPRRINFGDCDGWVEIGGCFAVLEWKGDGGAVRVGQYRTFQAFTLIPGNVVFVVRGDAETMEVQEYNVFWKGKSSPLKRASLSDVKERLTKWAEWAGRKREAA